MLFESEIQTTLLRLSTTGFEDSSGNTFYRLGPLRNVSVLTIITVNSNSRHRK